MQTRSRLIGFVITAGLAGLLRICPQIALPLAQATVFTYINSPPGAPNNTNVPTGFVADDELVNPAGLFNGVLQGDGNFVVFYGPKPHVGPVLWSAGVSATGNFGLSWYRNTTNSNTISSNYNVFKNGNQAYTLIRATLAPNPTFLSLNNNGTLSLYAGSNGKANGVAYTTTGKAASFNDLTVTSVMYDLAQATFPEVSKLFGTTQRLVNSLPNSADQTAKLELKYANTQAYDWNTSNTVSTTISSTSAIKVPGIGSTELSLELNHSTTISQGQSTSSGTETTYSSEVTIYVPAKTTYGVDIYATQQDALVPFTYTGFYDFADGTSVPVTGSGEFDGVSTGIFEAHAYCISPADFCDTAAAKIPDEPALPVPEPSSLATLLTGMCALGSVLAVGKRTARSRQLVDP